MLYVSLGIWERREEYFFCSGEGEGVRVDSGDSKWIYRFFYFIGQVYKFSGVRVFIGIQKVFIVNFQVFIEDFLDSYISVCARLGKESGQRK